MLSRARDLGIKLNFKSRKHYLCIFVVVFFFPREMIERTQKAQEMSITLKNKVELRTALTLEIVY